MGLFAPLAPLLRARLGTIPAIGFSLVLIAIFGFARVFAANIVVLVLMTFGVGAGMGLAGGLLPVLVKERFPDRSVRASGIYSIGIQVGATASAAFAVPIALAYGGWRVVLLAFTLATMALITAWGILARDPAAPSSRSTRERAISSSFTAAAAVSRPGFAFNSLLAWRLAIVFALFAIFYYGLVAWLTSAYVERGWPLEQAATLVALLNAGSVAGAIIVPIFSQRIRSNTRVAALLSLVLLSTAVGLAAMPRFAYACSLVAGIADGALFPVMMALPVESAAHPQEVGAITGVMLGLGYTVAALAPTGLGALRDQAGSFLPVLWLIAIAAGLQVVMVVSLAGDHRRPETGSA
jgi:CP family cyanate transporter-like MFS transporter